MKTLAKPVAVIEVHGEGLPAFLGKRITIFCNTYFYTGILEGVNDTFVKLSDAAIVYETGPFSDKNFKDAQKLGCDWYIQLQCIESFGPLKG